MSPPSHTGCLSAWSGVIRFPEVTHDGRPLAGVRRLGLAAEGSGCRAVLPGVSLGTIVLLVAQRGGPSLEGGAGRHVRGHCEGRDDQGKGGSGKLHFWKNGRGGEKSKRGVGREAGRLR